MPRRSTRSTIPTTLPDRALRLHRLDHPGGPLYVLSAPVTSALEEPALDARFSRAEAEIVGLVLRGWSNERIASETGRATRTVSNLLARACRKIGVTRRTELAHALARQAAVTADPCEPSAPSEEAARSEPQ